MPSFDWQDLMTKLNTTLLAHPDIESYVDLDEIETGWLGFPGATESQISAAERRLGVRLPARTANSSRLPMGGAS